MSPHLSTQITCCLSRVQAQPRKPVFVTPEVSLLLLVRPNSTVSKDKVCLVQTLKIATLRYASTIGHDTIMSHVQVLCEAVWLARNPSKPPSTTIPLHEASIASSAGVVDDQIECGVHLDQHLPCLSSTWPAPFAFGCRRRVPNAGIDSFCCVASPWKHRTWTHVDNHVVHSKYLHYIWPGATWSLKRALPSMRSRSSRAPSALYENMMMETTTVSMASSIWIELTSHRRSWSPSQTR
jgi:hypothetical protein